MPGKFAYEWCNNSGFCVLLYYEYMFWKQFLAYGLIIHHLKIFCILTKDECVPEGT